MKRTFDIVFSIIGLLFLVPVFLVVAILIKLTMPGPVFFLQTRIGLHAMPFIIYKFRSMKVNNENISVTLKEDKRITSVGRFLRKSKIDEFPQLWNILKGDMSFVGPRPDVPGYADQLKGDDRIILTVKPGLTGADSVFYPVEETLLLNQKDPIDYYNNVLYPDKVRLNKIYVRNRSVWLDMKLILLTIIRGKLNGEIWKN